jgi:hypothetical protein
VLEGHPARAYDWDIQKQVQVAVLGQSYEGNFIAKHLVIKFE